MRDAKQAKRYSNDSAFQVQMNLVNTSVKHCVFSGVTNKNKYNISFRWRLACGLLDDNIGSFG